MATAPTLSENISVWARRVLAVATLTEVDVWDAFERREQIAQQLAGVSQTSALSAHLDAMLAGADDLWHDQRQAVEPLLRLGTYLQSRPSDHYAHHYLSDRS